MKLSERIKSLRRMVFWASQHFNCDSSKFGFWGKGVRIIYPVSFNKPENIYIYDDVQIGANSMISAINSKFIIKSHAVTAENLMVRTGNHVMVVGKNFTEVDDKYKIEHGLIKESDKDVVVEENVWIGCNVTLLSGVKIGRNATIGAGSVVTKSIPPYSVAAGVPCRFLKFRWTIDEIIEHEKALYPEDMRFTREELQNIFEKYNN